MPKTIYLIRHAESEGNAEGRIQGWFDSPLNERGQQQAHHLASRLSAEAQFWAIFTSSLQRAVETAQILAGDLNCPLNFEDDLREYNMGPITGLTLSEIKARFPHRYLAFKRNERLAHLPGEEGEERFMERVRRCMEGIMRQVPEGQAALVVSHSGTLNVCLRNWLGLANNSRHPFAFDNASITVVEINKTTKRLICLNDTCHLAAVGKTQEIRE